MKKDLTEFYNNLKSLNEVNISHDEVELYMNTWGNYNNYGADAEAVNGGWKKIDEVMPWYEEMLKRDEEPFINDVDDYVGLPFEVGEGSNIPKTVEMIQDFLSHNNYDRKVIKSIAFAISTDDYDEVLDTFNKGEYIYFDGVESDAELGQEYIDMCGSFASALSQEDFDSYIDWDQVGDDWESDIRYNIAEEQGLESIDDVDEYELEERISEEVDEWRDAVKSRPDDFVDFLNNYFDYDDFGSSLTYDYTFTDTGAINIL